MATFRYRASGLQGECVEGEIDAATADGATDLLWSQGLIPFHVKAANGAGVPWWRREVFAGGKSQRVDLAAFTREFATLNSAEIPLDDTLRILCDQATTASIRTLATSLLADVLNGSTLSDAMAKQPSVFPAEYISVVKAGEASGSVHQVFVEMADLLERRVEVRARIQSALIYPCMLVVLGLVTLAIIVGSLVPSIAPVFIDNGKELPTTIWLFVGLQAHWLEIVFALTLGVAAAAGAFIVTLRQPGGRLALDRGKLKLPLAGGLLLKQETARFTRTLGTMLKAGVPLVQATASARDVVTNHYIAAALDRALTAVHQGVALHRALRAEAVLPAIALQMIAIGEEAGKLDRMLIRVATLFEQQTQRTIERSVGALTPILTVTIAIAVGALIVPIMSAVLSINDLAAR